MNLMFWRRRGTETPTTEHDAVLERLSAYLDGEVTDAEAAEVEALIARDPVAAALLEDLAMMTSAYSALGEVRATRSFAIPAEAAPAPRMAVALFRRTEIFVRASAAVAALFFVVALVNDPGASTPTSGPVAFEEARSTVPESMRGAQSAGATLSAEAADEPSSEDGDEGSAFGTMAAPDVPPNTGGGAAEDTSTTAAGETSRQAEELRPMPSGTEFFDDSSQGVGGMAPGLGVLAGLLAALAALTAWDRRSGGSTR